MPRLMPADFCVRRAVPDDAAALTAYVGRLVDEPHNNIGRDPGQWTKTAEEERQFIENLSADDVFFVADLGGEIVGCANAGRYPRLTERHVAVLGVSVDARHRRQGIGQALMVEIINWARENGIVRLELKVFTRNTAAIALYEKLGFVREGFHRKAALKQGVWCDDLSMAMIFDESSS